MVLASPSEPLSQLEVLVVDCQATAAAPRGHLLEIGWARVLGTTITHAHASLIALPDGEQIPPAVSRVTGISEPMMRSAVDGRCVWRELTDQAASLTQQPAPTVIHFARFEQPFLRALAAGVFPLDVIYDMNERAERQPRGWFAHSAVRDRYRGGAFVAGLGARGPFSDIALPWNNATRLRAEAFETTRADVSGVTIVATSRSV